MFPDGVARAAALAGALLFAGCSLLGNFSTVRCAADAECEGLGLHGYVCKESTCEQAAIAKTADASTEAGALAECTTNDECTRRAGEVPSVCAQGTCIAAKIPGTCPIILGEEYFRQPQTIVFGAFVEADPVSALGTYNIDLAIDEINRAGGVPSASGARHFSVVVCSKSTPALVTEGAQHLIAKLRLPAVFGQLETDELKDVAAMARTTDTLVLSTLGNDRSLRGTLSDAPVVFAAGDILDIAPAYGPLVASLESTLKSERSKTEIKVAMVASQSYETQALAAALDDPNRPAMRFNDKAPLEQSGTYYRRIDDVIAKYRSDKQPDYSKAIGQITEFQPDIVIGIAGDELVENIIPGVEAAWGANPNRPYYVAAPLSRFNVQLYDQTRPEPPKTLRRRFVGVDFSGSVTDLSAYDRRLAAHRNNLLSARPREGFNLLYDATYLVALATMAAGTDVPLGAKTLTTGIGRVTDPNGLLTYAGTTRRSSELDDDSFVGALGTLARGASVHFAGTSGRFDIDATKQNRIMGASLYCIDSKDIPRFRFYSVGYDATSGALTGLVDGKPPCW